MITLALLKFLEDNGFGKIDKDLFFQKLSLGKEGLYIVNVGNYIDHGTVRTQGFELYSRGKNDVDGYKKLEDVLNFLIKSYGVCCLPAVPPITTEKYCNVTIKPTSTISSIGQDVNGKMIYSITGTINY